MKFVKIGIILALILLLNLPPVYAYTEYGNVEGKSDPFNLRDEAAVFDKDKMWMMDEDKPGEIEYYVFDGSQYMQDQEMTITTDGITTFDHGLGNRLVLDLDMYNNSLMLLLWDNSTDNKTIRVLQVDPSTAIIQNNRIIESIQPSLLISEMLIIEDLLYIGRARGSLGVTSLNIYNYTTFEQIRVNVKDFVSDTNLVYDGQGIWAAINGDTDCTKCFYEEGYFVRYDLDGNINMVLEEEPNIVRDSNLYIMHYLSESNKIIGMNNHGEIVIFGLDGAVSTTEVGGGFSIGSIFGNPIVLVFLVAVILRIASKVPSGSK